MGVQVSLLYADLTLLQVVVLFLVFWETSRWFSIVAVLVYIPSIKFPFSPHPFSMCYFCFFLIVILTGKMELNVVLISFPWWKKIKMLNSFSYIVGHLYFFLLFLFAVLRVELRALHLLGMCHNTWTTPPALFVLVILEIGSHCMPDHLETRSSYLCFSL
jgi:hypothetical protein